MKPLECAAFSSPIGRGWVCRRGGAIVEVRFGGPAPAGARRKKMAIARKIERYLDGRRARFGERVEISGSAFARRVTAAVRAIPFGRTRTYGEIARAAGRPGAARAVGQVMKRNPVCLVVP